MIPTESSIFPDLSEFIGLWVGGGGVWGGGEGVGVGGGVPSTSSVLVSLLLSPPLLYPSRDYLYVVPLAYVDTDLTPPSSHQQFH